MNTLFIGNRITELRLQSNLSERKLSLALGHEESYINSITSKKKKNLPSLGELLYICEYFKITPTEFFNENKSTSLLKANLINYIYDAPEENILCLLNVVQLFK